MTPWPSLEGRRLPEPEVGGSNPPGVVTPCPVCGGKLVTKVFVYERGGELLIVSRCEDCGYRSVDTEPLEEKGEKSVILEFPKDLNTVVYIPPETEVEGEGIHILYTRHFGGRITTGEGILLSIMDHVKGSEGVIKPIVEGKKETKLLIKNERGGIRILSRAGS